MSRVTGDMTPQEAWDLLTRDPAAVLVDVRTRAEWSFVGVPDLGAVGRTAQFVEWTTFPTGEHNEGFLEEVARAAADREAPVLFLCRSGQRSIGAAEAAAAAGWTRAYNVLEGFEGPVVDGHRSASGWRAAGLPWRQS